MDLQIIISVLSLLGLGGIVGGYIQHLLNQKRETELRIQSLNEGRYRSILVFMRCVLKPENVNQFCIDDSYIQRLKSDEAIKKYATAKLTEFYYNSVLYASDNVLRRFKQFMNMPSEHNFMETAIAMRKDLWNKGTKLNLDCTSLD
ncbi:MAG: hypothetical protein PHC66_04365 [Candidatus Nanoarchaeia archaeon]|nr:hypothetical protein [Candidatus Nanoarchaeia archaeon]MDD5239453.1 hypothetical protein [Candidatus Nanoarchaeia archaeon]